MLWIFLETDNNWNEHDEKSAVRVHAAIRISITLIESWFSDDWSML